MSRKKVDVINVYEYCFNDLSQAMGKLGELQRERESVIREYEDRISKLQAELAEKIDPLDREIKKISHSLKYFMDENKSSYITEDRKTLKLETGDISYRKGKPSVKTRSSEKLITEILEKNGLLKTRDAFVKKCSSVFLRTKLELDKDAILANPMVAVKVTGVEIEDGIERFYLKPYATSTELEVV
jgi:phage host-nuclease inhibitor protein Gam